LQDPRRSPQDRKEGHAGQFCAGNVSPQSERSDWQLAQASDRPTPDNYVNLEHRKGDNARWCLDQLVVFIRALVHASDLVSLLYQKLGLFSNLSAKLTLAFAKLTVTIPVIPSLTEIYRKVS